MLRIFISFVLCLLLTFSPIAGLQFERQQVAGSENVSVVETDKPEYTYQKNDGDKTYQESKDRINTADGVNAYTRAESGKKLSVDSAIASSDDAGFTGKNANATVAGNPQASENQNEFALSKPVQAVTKEAKTASTSGAVTKQSHPGSANATEGLAGYSNTKSDEVSEEHNDPVPAGSGTAAAGQAAPVQKETAQKNTASAAQAPVAAADGKVIDTSMVNSGLIGIRYLNRSGKRLKLMVEKDGKRYTYNLKGDNSLETFPLQSGNGDYKISIMENTEGNRYRYLITETVSVKANNANAAYLNSIQMINWNRDMAAIKKAAELTSGISQEEEKVKAIYNFIVSNIRYDTGKLNNLPSTYLPVIDETYKTKLGICYDFASLNAAMLRSVGIPAKLVMGYAEGVNGYHAWNEVYMGGKWVTIDASYDSQMREAGQSYSMKKDSSKYQAQKEY